MTYVARRTCSENILARCLLKVLYTRVFITALVYQKNVLASDPCVSVFCLIQLSSIECKPIVSKPVASTVSDQLSTDSVSSKRFACDLCPMSLKTAKILKIHRREIHGINRTTYECHVCQKYASFRKSNLVRHVNKRHRRCVGCADVIQCDKCSAVKRCG